MFHIVIAAHGGLAHAYVDVCQQLLGKQDKIWPLSFDHCELPENHTDLKNLLHRIPVNENIIILCDLFGGTPADAALSFMGQNNVEVVTGINLPFLLKLVNLRNSAAPASSIKSFIQEASQAGQQALQVASSLLYASSA